MCHQVFAVQLCHAGICDTFGCAYCSGTLLWVPACAERDCCLRQKAVCAAVPRLLFLAMMTVVLANAWQNMQIYINTLMPSDVYTLTLNNVPPFTSLLAYWLIKSGLQ